METKYIPQRFAGKEIGLESRGGAVIFGIVLVALSPVYLVSDGISRLREYFSPTGFGRVNELEEFWDTIKLCGDVALTGKFPERDTRGE